MGTFKIVIINSHLEDENLRHVKVTHQGSQCYKVQAKIWNWVVLGIMMEFFRAGMANAI